ncbi:carboxy methyl transferase for protein phosphatase 2A, partial [Coelomomyces lativittatus]
MSSMDVSSDEILRATDDDAAISRLSSVHQNYLEDPFSTFFVSASMQPTRRSPLINRGTYLRIYSIDQVMRAFLEGFPKGSRQIVNLGAGTDTRYFRFKKFHSDLLQQVKYFEIDFEETILHKISIIRKRKVLSQLLTQVRY